MSKNIIIKLAILLVVAALVYSVFWFFKVGQVEKQVNKFISENSNYISAGEVAVSGFPLSQKITVKDLKFTIPNALLSKRQTIVKHLEASAGIFSSDFAVTLVEPVTVQDIDNNSATVNFSKDPEITISLTDGRVSKFKYQDFGYRIIDAEKNVIYAASQSSISLQSEAGEGDKITTKITAQIKDIEGFDVLDIYKNAFEKKVIEGIKTGEISIGTVAASVDGTQPSVALALPGSPAAPAAVAPAPVVPAAPAIPAAVLAAAAPTGVPAVANNAAPVPAPAPVAPEALAASATNTNLVKNNFALDLEYILTPIQGEQQAQIPADPTQIQEVPLQYNKAVKITNLEFSNPLYKIFINGEMNILPDDNMPSGSVAIKVEKIDTLISYITTGFNQMLEQKKPAITDVVQSTDLAATSGMPVEDSYQSFLKRVVINLSPVGKELAAKNAVSKEDIAEFDIRREKNLEFLVNETSVREVLGKF